MSIGERLDDFPYYRGSPIELSPYQWLIPLTAVAFAVWILLSQPEVFSTGVLRLSPALLLALLPLAGLAIVAGRQWRALFRPVGWKEVGWMIAFAALNTVVAIPLGLAAQQLMETQANPGITGLGTMETSDQVLFFVNSIPQLIGEEMITIIPFLAILYLLHSKLELGRSTSIIVAWFVTAVWFAAIHLPTYNWNVIQCLLLIGVARLVLTFAYIKTKNLWVSAGAHIINDWLTFGLAIIAANGNAAS